MTVLEADASHERLRIRFRGTVQGVGFRPFVHGLAARHGLSGFVLNDPEGVLAEVEGAALDGFLTALQRERPPLARIDGIDIARVPLQRAPGFAIRDSVTSPGTSPPTSHTQVGADAATCPSCFEEVFDPGSRFHLYPFTTCTNCGPRFTITHRTPYDRPNTSMAKFPPCADCASDYANSASRRFHAEAIACPACGPRLSHTLHDIAAVLGRGQIVALKGIGGFHLLCDAKNEAAVQTLRSRKNRPRKPFAVMVANTASAEQFSAPTAEEKALLRHIARPIVMVRARAGLAPSVAPGLDRIGLMLPAAPVHHLLFHALESRHSALVATSANGSGDPLVIDDEEATQSLAAIADLIVTHNRAVLARADDSVMAVIDGAPAFIRRSRGFVPEPIDLGEDGPVVLATGAHLKTTLCVTRGREAFISQHVGDLSTGGTLRFYHETARRMLSMLDVAPVLAVCDLHPDLGSTVFAEAASWPLLRVQHHAAHLAAVAAEHRLRGAVLGVALDGHGYGADGTSWGGELMLLDWAARGTGWRRCGHLRPLPLPGGDRAAREPWRMGAAALSVLGRGAEIADRFPKIADASRLASVLAAVTRWPETTSMGRLFDAAASLLGVCTHQSYEGQAAMELEALVHAPVCVKTGYRIAGDILDFTPLLACLLTPGLTPREGADLFHGTVIAGVADWIGQSAARMGQTNIMLGGGCLMNRVLSEGLCAALRGDGLVPWLARAVPANDGGLSLGQAVMGRAHLNAAQLRS